MMLNEFNRINVAAQFLRTAELYPDKLALIYNEEKYSFGELERVCSNIGYNLKSSIGSGTIVATFLEGKSSVVIADLGILLSGNCFMNLDVAAPKERVRNVIAQTQPSVIITDKVSENIIKEIYNNYLLLDDLVCFLIENMREGIIEFLSKIDTDPFCIINTSGTTGTPKSVVLNHRSFIDFMYWADSVYSFTYGERIASLSPVVFDIYVYELCMMIYFASTIIMIPAKLATFPYRLLQYLEKMEPTFLFWVPTIMVNIANRDMLNGINLSTIKKIWFAGEVFPTKQFNYWYERMPETQFTNLYGPIEITVDCTYYIINHKLDDSEEIPLGYPCKNSGVIILNSNNELAGVNEEGEICVRGTSLAMGYYNDKKNTEKHFVQNPLNNMYPELIYRTGDIGLVDERGLIMFKGRRDSLIKHLGYRIELNEIEHVIINVLQLVENGCAVYNYDQRQIVFVYESKNDISPKLFRSKLAQKLPKYMIPTIYVKMSIMPTNTNGKLNRLKICNLINKDK